MPDSLELQTVRLVVAEHPLPLTPEDGMAFVAYTDGSCLRNPGGPSGFAAVVQAEASGKVREISGHLPVSTNNRAEWAGLAAALLAVPRGSRLLAFTDSEYILHVASGKWKRKKNIDLWQEWDELRHEHPLDLDLRWVRGHDGQPGNERADWLATRAALDSSGAASIPAMSAPDALAVESLLPLARDDWERTFLSDITKRLQRGQGLSHKQQAIVDRISARAAG